MYFHSVQAFFLMGHYDRFIWPAYLIVLCGLIIWMWRIKQKLTRIKKQLASEKQL